MRSGLNVKIKVGILSSSTEQDFISLVGVERLRSRYDARQRDIKGLPPTS
jgi:hypothetical protein